MNKTEAEEGARKAAEAMDRIRREKVDARLDAQTKEKTEKQQRLERNQAVLNESGVLEVVEAMVENGIIKMNEEPQCWVGVQERKWTEVLDEGYIFGIRKRTREGKERVIRLGKMKKGFCPAIVEKNTLHFDGPDISVYFDGKFRDVQDGDLIDDDRVVNEFYMYDSCYRIRIYVHDEKLHIRGYLNSYSVNGSRKDDGDWIVGQDGDLFELLGRALENPEYISFVRRIDPSDYL